MFCLHNCESNPEMAVHQMYGRASIYRLFIQCITHEIGNAQKMNRDEYMG